MNAELKAKWLEALRSGKYEQGRGNFLSEGKYCCLGVLCDVAGAPIKRGVGRDAADNYSFVENEAGVGDASWKLTQMNDHYPSRKSFSEIADWIEANL